MAGLIEDFTNRLSRKCLINRVYLYLGSDPLIRASMRHACKLCVHARNMHELLSQRRGTVVIFFLKLRHTACDARDIQNRGHVARDGLACDGVLSLA